MAARAPIMLFGGSFDPPHVGHVLATAWLLATERARAVWWLPTFVHAFDKRLAQFEHRVEMARLALGSLRGDLTVDPIEGELGAPSRTVRTLEALHARHRGERFGWLIGSDLLPELASWYRPDRLAELANLLVLPRAGYPVPDDCRWAVAPVSFPAVSSTEVRRRLGSGQSIDGLVPATVARYLAQHQLYR